MAVRRQREQRHQQFLKIKTLRLSKDYDEQELTLPNDDRTQVARGGANKAIGVFRPAPGSAAEEENAAAGTGVGVAAVELLQDLLECADDHVANVSGARPL